MTKKGFYMTDYGLSRSEKRKILKHLGKGNLDTDSSPYFEDLSYHFNRGLEESPLQAQQKYLKTLFKEIIGFFDDLYSIKPSNCMTDDDRKKCMEALERLGRISHMLQDFYAHAVSMQTNTVDDEVGSIPSWASPLLPFAVKPSSFDISENEDGEHGKTKSLVSEPGNRAPDRKKRKEKSIMITNDLFKNLLPFWLKKCKNSL